jgi:Zn-dependent alcohol dehydrogenase
MKKVIAWSLLLAATATFAGPSMKDYSEVALSSNYETCDAYLNNFKTGKRTRLKGKALEPGTLCVVSIPRGEFERTFEMCQLTSHETNGVSLMGGCHLNVIPDIVEFSAEGKTPMAGSSYSTHSCKWACKRINP